jgi:diguanylate cyclase (GGDEF)-like protein/PAS domain S-box-containing protein
MQKSGLTLYFSRFFLVLIGYVAFGHIGLAFPYLDQSISLIWLPTGISVAALLRWGPNMAWAILFSDIIFSSSAGEPLSIIFGLAVGNTLGPLFTYWQLQRKQFSPALLRRRDILGLSLAAAAGMFISAAGGTLVLWLTANVDQPLAILASWWSADTIGVLLMTPLLLTISSDSLLKLFARRKEIILFCTVFAATNWLMYFSPYAHLHLTFMAMVMVIWGAMRFNVTGASLTVLASAAIAAWATYTSQGQFSSSDATGKLVILWLLLAMLTLVSLFITALQAERLLVASESKKSLNRIRKVAARLPGLIMQYRVRPDRSIEIPYASDATESIFEMDPGELQANLPYIFKHIDPKDLVEGRLAMRHSARTRSAWKSEFRYRRKDGSIRWLYVNAMPETEEDGSRLWHCFISDVTERKQVEQDLRVAAITFESQESIFVTDGKWTILKVNQAFHHATGYTDEELIGITIPRLMVKNQDAAFFNQIDVALELYKCWKGELWGRRKNGEIFPQTALLTAITDNKGVVSNYIGAFTDISRHKGYEEEIRHLAFFDSLTQLPNRRLLMDRLQHLISVSQRNTSHSALLFIDLDNFKTLNDTRGHDAGDLLLIEAAQRLQTCVRDSDTVARLGGDEFVVVLEELSSVRDEAINQADLVSEKIRMLLNEPFQIADFEHHGSGSIGVCLFQGGDNTVKDLFKRADTAMYEAKASGRNTVRFFDPAMQAVLVVRMMLESNLRVALALEQFQLYYQVQVNAEGKLIGAEALLRWTHPDRGFISPAEFIPLAEETGLIVPIGLWVMETACAQIKAWEADVKTAHLSLAVNVSAKQFKQADFVETISEIVGRHAINPTRLKIELTESTILDNVDATTEKMHQLKKLGIEFSMDDFGTGYSSLAYLQRLPLNQLKIDQSFVRDLSDDENDATIVRAIISLGINLGLNVIAEGVETLEQRQFLIEHNCFAFQGYLFSKPVPIEGLLELFAQLEKNDAQALSGPTPEKIQS